MGQLGQISLSLVSVVLVGDNTSVLVVSFEQKVELGDRAVVWYIRVSGTLKRVSISGFCGHPAITRCCACSCDFAIRSNRFWAARVSSEAPLLVMKTEVLLSANEDATVVVFGHGFVVGFC